MTLTTTKKKVEIMREKKKLRQLDHQMYINEHLTPTQAEIFAHARSMVKKKQLTATWTRDGRVFVKVRDRDQPKLIKTKNEL